MPPLFNRPGHYASIVCIDGFVGHAWPLAHSRGCGRGRRGEGWGAGVAVALGVARTRQFPLGRLSLAGGHLVLLRAQTQEAQATTMGRGACVSERIRSLPRVEGCVSLWSWDLTSLLGAGVVVVDSRQYRPPRRPSLGRCSSGPTRFPRWRSCPASSPRSRPRHPRRPCTTTTPRSGSGGAVLHRAHGRPGAWAGVS
jgi:hypothetical protein